MMDGSSLNPVDLVVLAVVLLSALLAFARGFVREVLSIAAWIGAALVTLWGFNAAAPIARAYVEQRYLADIATGLSLFTLALIAFSILTHSLSARVQDSSLSAIDRSLGFAFGVARGAAVVCLAFLFSTWLWRPEEEPEWLRSARTRPMLASGAEMLRTLLPVRPGDGTPLPAAPDRDIGVQRALELERLSNPVPAAGPPAPETSRGYSQQERGQLNQLLENTGGQEAPPDGR
ncbi:CvpA family protein [Rhodocista pekingensis]|uniref:CvpA family protein n=1 Tax=Rhodocista pekingensis TaxID=201185 RepID=A0ABW2KZS1_9PROT